MLVSEFESTKHITVGMPNLLFPVFFIVGIICWQLMPTQWT